jgi:hypothetical protein
LRQLALRLLGFVFVASSVSQRKFNEYNVKTTEEMARACDGFKYFAHFPRVIIKMASSLESSSTWLL